MTRRRSIPLVSGIYNARGRVRVRVAIRLRIRAKVRVKVMVRAKNRVRVSVRVRVRVTRWIGVRCFVVSLEFKSAERHCARRVAGDGAGGEAGKMNPLIASR